MAARRIRIDLGGIHEQEAALLRLGLVAAIVSGRFVAYVRPFGIGR